MTTEEVEGAERPVREKLKKASIHGVTGDNTTPPVEPLDGVRPDSDKNDVAANPEVGESTDSERHRPVLNKKRSFEDVDNEASEGHNTAAEPHVRHHRRKRSRDSTAEEEELGGNKKRTSEEQSRDGDHETAPNGVVKPAPASRPATPEIQSTEKRTETVVDGIASPKTKRSRLQGASSSEAHDTLQTSKEDVADPLQSVPDASEKASHPTSIEPKAAPTSQAQTSNSAFAASGFSALATSSTSGFGAIGKPSGAGFGTGGNFATPGKQAHTASSDVKESERPPSPSKPSASTFGGALGAKSAFATAGKANQGGFGSVAPSNGGFGAGFGSGGFGALGGTAGLTSFATGKQTPAFAASKPVKPFGASAEDNEDADDAGEGVDESGIKSPLSTGTDEEKRDERFYEQELETGEENEDIVYQCRAKLYNWTANESGKKEWKERGLGVLRLNIKRNTAEQEGLVQSPVGNKDDAEAEEKGVEESKKVQARFLMRADGSHRVVLNTPIQKDIKFGSVQGGAPQGGLMLFMGTVDDKSTLELLQLKMKQQFALELHEKILDLQKEM